VCRQIPEQWKKLEKQGKKFKKASTKMLIS